MLLEAFNLLQHDVKLFRCRGDMLGAGANILFPHSSDWSALLQQRLEASLFVLGVQSRRQMHKAFDQSRARPAYLARVGDVAAALLARPRAAEVNQQQT